MYKFVHFRVYSEYSLNKSIISLKKLINKTKINNQKSLCISDENNLFNSLRFYKECIKNHIKPIIGCDLYLIVDDKKYNIILIAENILGYYNILKILSKINIFNKNLKLDFNILKGELNKNLFLILNLNNYNKKYNIKESVKISKKIKKRFRNNFYLEIQRKKNNKNYKKIIELSKIVRTPLIFTNPISFIKKKDFFIYKAKIFISKNKNKNNKVLKSHYFYKKEKIFKIFNKNKKFIKNNFELSKKCNLIIDFDKIKLPFFKLKYNCNNNIYFINLLNKKLKKLKIKNKIYKERLKYELKIIIRMHLSDYFLIVKDFISWSKKKYIQVGPGRGSSAGSLVSFLLNITELDPIKYDLLFERFLNSERVNMPDFDIDFSPEDREKVIRYIKEKYGLNCISQIITFNKMATKSSIKDIGKFLNFNFDFINEINKIISFNNNLNIIEILKKDKNFYNKYKNNKKIKKLIKLTLNMEGLVKNIGVHAGGVVMSPSSNFNFFSILKHNNIVISGYFKDDLEEIGILKFDFLGLITLSIIKNTLKNINKNINFNLRKIDLKDKNCYKNLKNGNTIGVFQLESEGIRSILNRVKPNNFENIIAIISLYRPGPIKLINDFCLKKLGKKKIIYLDEKLKPILKETYGIIIYQEQIMQIVRTVSNYSLNEADNLRRLISKKKIEDMSEEKKKFIEKSINNKFSIKKTILIFNLIKEFAKYGFNKSHAAAYSFLTYYTLWLKTYYSEYFMSSNMTYYFNDIKKVKIFIDDSIKNGIYILPFNINFSNDEFLPLKNKKNKKIRYGFKGILGLGVNIIKSIIKSRKNGYFKNFLDFYKRINKRIVNFKSIESIICAGGFDSLNYNRANLIKELNIFSKINFKEKYNLNIIKNVYFKKKFFWKFKIKILEERNSLNFFFINNINNIYEKKYNIYKKKNNYQSGIIINISEKIINNNLIINVINNYNKDLQLRIKKTIFNKNVKIIKKYQFILFEKIKSNNVNIITNIINFKKIKC